MRTEFRTLIACALLFQCAPIPARDLPDGQALGANARRLVEALDYLGAPLPEKIQDEILDAARRRDAESIQKLLDPHVLFLVEINPELRVKARRGPAEPVLQQAGFTPHIVKVLNLGTASQRLRVESPQAGPVYGGVSQLSLERQQQTQLRENENQANDPNRFLALEMFTAPPMTEHLSGLEVEYCVALIYSSEAGEREAAISFNIGQGTQDIGFRAEAPVLFKIRPAIPVRLSIRDHDGAPTAARLIIRDSRGGIFPPQPKRLAPDLFFQPQIYRMDGGMVLLPPGKLRVTYGRGPEYLELNREIEIPSSGEGRVELRLERWIDPMEHGFYAGDHHIHAAGCAHYEIPTQGITPLDMFMQVKGEGLNVGCVLTWGPCYDFQRRFFSPTTAQISEPFTILKYDLEISGFGSQALGHVCLLNLKDQTYPGSDGTKTKGWPTWTVPVLRWTKEQGGVTGYPHSDPQIDPPGYAKWILRRADRDADSKLSPEEARNALLPKPFSRVDLDSDRSLSLDELAQIADTAGNELPNLVLPAMRGAGAMEIFVSAAEGVCDFISAMNTGRIGEWNTWYHLLNCGLPIKVSGETDFPCMSSRRVGQGRVYVNLGTNRRSGLDFTEWCRALAQGRSYVSDGYAHALEFTVNGAAPGFQDVQLSGPEKVHVRAKVAFAPETPRAVAHGTLDPAEGRRHLGDTRVLHAPRTDEMTRGGDRLIEIVVNGQSVAATRIPADGKIHELRFEIPLGRSSWVALRHFPQLHTNPVNVQIGGKTIRASSESARWCAESVELLWENRGRFISDQERPAARAAYDRAIALYRARELEARAAGE